MEKESTVHLSATVGYDCNSSFTQTHRIREGTCLSSSIERHMIGLVGAVWGLTGIIAILIYALIRLGPMFFDAFSHSLMWYHWVVLIGNVIFMAHSEGYRGFQKSFSPRVAARAKHLYHHPSTLRVVLAPLFCMGYFHIYRRRQIVVYALMIFIIIVILIIRQLPQPWRGVIDAGVVVGLSWGLISLIIFSIQAFVSDTFQYSPDIPEQPQ